MKGGNPNPLIVGASRIHDFGSGCFNMFAGYMAGNLTMTASFPTSGCSLTAFGAHALESITTGFNNAAFGYALPLVTEGHNNAAFGDNALAGLITGNFNTAIGNNALVLLSTGSENTACGEQALQGQATTSKCTACGRLALYATQAGGNTGLGAYAGDNNITGQNNTYVGNGSDASATNLDNAAAIGYNAVVRASNQMILGGDSTDRVTVALGGNAALATNATVGFFCLPSAAGVPTGTPANIPTGTIPSSVDSVSGQLNLYNAAWSALPRTLDVNVAAVGNVGTGTDDLITYAIPANVLARNGKTIRVKAWGTTANNANAKTLTFVVGSQTVVSTLLTASIAGMWEIEVLIVRTGSNTQDIVARTLQGATLIFDQELTAGTQTDTAGITVKCTGNATSNNDIVQEGMVTEVLN